MECKCNITSVCFNEVEDLSSTILECKFYKINFKIFMRLDLSSTILECKSEYLQEQRGYADEFK